MPRNQSSARIFPSISDAMSCGHAKFKRSFKSVMGEAQGVRLNSSLLCCTGHSSRYRPRLGLRRLPCGTLRGAFRKFFHAVEDNLRQLNYLLTQFSVFRNIALNTVAIGLELFVQRLEFSNETINFTYRSF